MKDFKKKLNKENEVIEPVVFCDKCKAENKKSNKYCLKCGLKFNQNKSEKIKDRLFKNSLIFITIIYSLDLIILFFNHIMESDKPLIWDITWDSIYIAYASVFVYLNRRKLKDLFSIKKIKVPILIGVILVSIVWAIIVYWYVGFIADFFDFPETVRNYKAYGFTNKWIYFLYLCYTAVLVPAITEEVLMRGVLYNYLKNITSEKSVIYITAFLFAITHFSIVSATWIIFSGIFYAFLRYKTKNLLYSIIAHMTHNFIVSFILVYNL